MQKYCGGFFPHRQVILRKPDPVGAKIDCLCEPNGFLYNGIPATKDPLPYDEQCGRVFAVCLALLEGSTLGPRGKNYLEENRVVSSWLVSYLAYLVLYHIYLVSYTYTSSIHNTVLYHTYLVSYTYIGITTGYHLSSGLYGPTLLLSIISVLFCASRHVLVWHNDVPLSCRCATGHHERLKNGETTTKKLHHMEKLKRW